MSTPYATKKEVAARLRITTRCLEMWMAKGLPYIRLGRRILFNLEAVDAHIVEKFTVNAK